MRLVTVNLLWVIGLLLLIISAFAVVTPSGGLLKEYIGFAASIASILLALVAIFYAFISNGSFSSTLSEVKAAASQLAAETSRLNDASTGLSDEAEAIIRRLENLPERVSEFRGEIAQKIDNLSSSKIRATGEGAFENDLSQSVGYKSTIYLLAKASKSGMSFAPENIFRGLDGNTASLFSNAIIEVFRLHSIKNVNIEGIEGRYFVNSFGDYEVDEVIEKTKSSVEFHNHPFYNEMISAIDKFFDRDSDASDASESKNPDLPPSDKSAEQDK